jgi:acetyl esterase/lipase
MSDRPVALAMILLSAVAAAPQTRPDSARTPSPPGRRPGDVLRFEPFTGPPAASAWKIVYASTGLKGEPIEVSGLLVIPDGAAPPGGRRVIAWAHPTSGIGETCAPSLLPTPLEKIPQLRELVRQGFLVTATDYPGLGTPGPHPYLIGISEGRAVLDAVRAARRFPKSGAGTKYAVWGHSQGGHAALFAGQIAAAYAPELTLVGVAAVAPATDLEQLLKDDIGERVGRVLASFALTSWAQVYGVPADDILNPPARPIVRRVARDCVGNIFEGLKVEADAWALTPKFLLRDIYTAQPWQRILAENQPGQTPAGAPVYVAQGTEDELVRPEVTAAFVKRLCGNGEKVVLEKLLGVNHLTAGRDSALSAIAWMTERFEGEPPRTTCGAR